MNKGSRTLMQAQKEAGNALFLILIAVVLFAALAYAITQFSGKSGNGREQGPLASTGVTQYSSAIRTGVTRMLLRDIPIDEIDFTMPPEGGFQGLSDEQARKMVFHPAGGGVSYAPIDPSIVSTVLTSSESFNSKQNGNWHFVRIKVMGIGTDASELVAALDDVKQSVCLGINRQITGSKTIPVINGSSHDILNGTVPLTDFLIDGQPFLCIKSKDSYIYYHVLAEQ